MKVLSVDVARQRISLTMRMDDGAEAAGQPAIRAGATRQTGIAVLGMPRGLLPVSLNRPAPLPWPARAQQKNDGRRLPGGPQ